MGASLPRQCGGSIGKFWAALLKTGNHSSEIRSELATHPARAGVGLYSSVRVSDSWGKRDGGGNVTLRGTELHIPCSADVTRTQCESGDRGRWKISLSPWRASTPARVRSRCGACSLHTHLLASVMEQQDERAVPTWQSAVGFLSGW